MRNVAGREMTRFESTVFFLTVFGLGSLAIVSAASFYVLIVYSLLCTIGLIPEANS